MIGLYVGRFQPFHNGHLSIIRKAIQECDILVIVVGSIDKSNDKNPFPFKETQKIITHAVGSLKPNCKVYIKGLEDSECLEPHPDYPFEGNQAHNDRLWCYHLGLLVDEATDYKESGEELVLFGSVKKNDPRAAEYQQIIMKELGISNYVFVPPYTVGDTKSEIHATDIRNELNKLKEAKSQFIENVIRQVPMATLQYLLSKV